MGIPIKVLIVDDDQICREILADALAALGVEVTLAGDGMQGLERLAVEPFDILITDLNMPRMDGLTLLQKARELYPHILTIIITGYGSLESAIEAIRTGTYDYIQKPFKIEEIQIVTRNAIEKIQMLREKNLMIEELRAAYRKLHQFEAERESRPESHLEDFSEGTLGTAKTLYLFPRHTLPLSLLEGSSDEPNRVLAVLERLKDLRRQKIINDDELERLKKSVLEKMDN